MRRSGLDRTSGRLGVLLAIVALVATACGSSTTPSRLGGGMRRGPRPARRRTHRAAASPHPDHRRDHRQPGDVEIRWYCCLGSGDAPEQVAVEQQVVEDFNARHPDIHLTFEVVPYDAARDALADPDRLRQRAGHRRARSGVGGAEAFHGQWLDLAPLIDKTGYDLTQFPQSAVDLYKIGGEGQIGHPVRDLSLGAVLQGRACSRRPASTEPPHEYGKYTMPDGSTVAWDYDTVRKLGQILTVDENGKDATEPAFDPEQDRPVRLRAAARRPAPAGRLLGAGVAGRRRRQDRRDPRRVGRRWKCFYDGMWNGPLHR